VLNDEKSDVIVNILAAVPEVIVFEFDEIDLRVLLRHTKYFCHNVESVQKGAEVSHATLRGARVCEANSQTAESYDGNE
jgi:hypothetical protein